MVTQKPPRFLYGTLRGSTHTQILKDAFLADHITNRIFDARLLHL